MSTFIQHQGKKKESVALSSIAAGIGLTGTKFVVGILTGSIGILSEAAHSLLDVAAAVLTYFAVRFGDQPADKDHPFGHGKMESVSAFVETGLLFLTSIGIIYEAVRRLLEGGRVEAPWYAFAVIIFAIIVDISRSRALYRVAKETNSQALEADALHFHSDIWSSGAVLVGLGFVWIGIPGADAIAAIVVALFVGLAGYRLGRRTIDVLVDKAPEGVAEKAHELAERVEGISRVIQVRARPLGSNVFIEVRIAVDRTYSVEKTHRIATLIEQKIETAIPNAEVAVHIEPA